MTSPSPLLQEGSWLVLFPSVGADWLVLFPSVGGSWLVSALSSNFSSPYRGSKEGVTFLL